MTSSRDSQAGCVWHNERKGPACLARPTRAFNVCEKHFLRILAADPNARNYLPHDPHELCACETCGCPTSMLGTGKCDPCWELENRLGYYLRRGGEKARAFVLGQLTAIALVLGAVGCGGAPFSLPRDGAVETDGGTIGDPSPDAAAGWSDVEVDAVKTPDASDAGQPSPDAGPDGDPPKPDAAPDGAPARDAAPRCTTPIATTPRDLCPGETGNRVFPSTYVRSGAAGDCTTIAGFFATPPACACAETYTCECLTATGLGPSCAMIGGIPWMY